MFEQSDWLSNWVLLLLLLLVLVVVVIMSDNISWIALYLGTMNRNVMWRSYLRIKKWTLEKFCNLFLVTQLVIDRYREPDQELFLRALNSKALFLFFDQNRDNEWSSVELTYNFSSWDAEEEGSLQKLKTNQDQIVRPTSRNGHNGFQLQYKWF